MGNKWLPLKQGQYIRRTSDGEWEGKRVERVDHVERKNRAIRNRAKKRPSHLDAGPLGQLVASYPMSIAQEINDQCGHDPEKQKAYLRDHPEWCTAPTNSIGAGSKRVFLGPASEQYQRNFSRIFPERSNEDA